MKTRMSDYSFQAFPRLSVCRNFLVDAYSCLPSFLF